ncbi:MAG: polysaccharide deacetylase family protein [Pseudonocardia sp.]|uniref:polysaccharide deacetylase family protein n=1 Tax=unclassified Pseudonocardia TaxID=2619320 RepID=UPI00086E1A15|nr:MULTISPECIES: polysaccharide deacetylase family protein [unclassified Pseudonocardia]MBN9110447.1 polysaccharide deacetylase family protein [Pseudonocardia sp.]ODU29770.1 MAG: polysaccharide deacetylase [Pseudonocardia sp. SCN 72-51]ODV03471.1 MAG: polysaccharide deacetylase [Pseudonocardia sp. SCN 73-27]
MSANPLYRYSPITERPPVALPGGAALAFWLGINVEHFEYGVPSTSLAAATSGFVPDPLNHGWRDYGTRVGIWRTIELLDELGMPATMIVNAAVCAEYPQIVRAGVERGWAFVAHGWTNSHFHTGLDEPAERAELCRVTETIADATGRAPVGWLGPGMTETGRTPELLRELGYLYVLDWCADDQPFATRVPGLLSVPYAAELNDSVAIKGQGHSAEAFGQMIRDQCEVLRTEGRTRARVMALGLHPFVTGVPFRHLHLAAALRHVAVAAGVWRTTSDAIAEYWSGQLA